MNRLLSLPLSKRLAETSRLPLLAGDQEAMRGIELIALSLTGFVAAALSSFIDLSLRMPGHHILYSVFPMAMGFALVPRRHAGLIMGTSALSATALLGFAGARVPGIGALTSLALTGPLLDIALRRGGRGWRLYAAFVLAGASSNAVAFAARALTKAMGIRGMGGGRALNAWLPQAVWTYALAGVLAGLISAAAWFHLRDRGNERA